MRRTYSLAAVAALLALVIFVPGLAAACRDSATWLWSIVTPSQALVGLAVLIILVSLSMRRRY